ncbi:ParB N-terminal domain-containing protein [Nocardioides sp. NPDC058538]|uniref:ParB N-terminal domain-containing protein n=1 Tax=Nocardioides sp. NPDC058538 TaxID=3346542 RepID=UPI003660C30A
MSPETERALDEITVGIQHRTDLGDIAELADSIEQIGLLQPITITPDGVLVCGRRRLEAVRHLGHRTIKVWIRSGISDRLTELLAQQDENKLHKPLTQIEQANLYAELKDLYAEENRRRQEASRFGADDGVGVPGEATSAGENGADDSSAPRYSRETRYQAAQTVTGSGSFQRLDHIRFLQAVANDPFQPPTVRELATNELAAVEEGGPVEPAYRKVQAAIELAAQTTPETDDLARLATEAMQRVKQSKARRGLHAPKPAKPPGHESAPPRYRTLRSFLLTWTELEGWTEHYDLDRLARDLTDEEYARFNRVIDESVAFRDRIEATRQERANAPA